MDTCTLCILLNSMSELWRPRTQTHTHTCVSHCFSLSKAYWEVVLCLCLSKVVFDLTGSALFFLFVQLGSSKKQKKQKKLTVKNIFVSMLYLSARWVNIFIIPWSLLFDIIKAAYAFFVHMI